MNIYLNCHFSLIKVWFDEYLLAKPYGVQTPLLFKIMKYTMTCRRDRCFLQYEDISVLVLGLCSARKTRQVGDTVIFQNNWHLTFLHMALLNLSHISAISVTFGWIMNCQTTEINATQNLKLLVVKIKKKPLAESHTGADGGYFQKWRWRW